MMDIKMCNNRADEAQIMLDKLFWNNDIKMYNNIYPLIDIEEDNKVFNYWWLAHALEVLIDGYERTQDNKYLVKCDELIEAIKLKNNNVIINDFYDDMLWMAIAILRLYDNTNNEKYLNEVNLLWEDIKKGWNDHQGGAIAWRKEQLDYKNVPANAPAIILACRLYKRFNKQEDLDWAIKIYNWLNDNLLDRTTGIIWDGLNREGDGKIDKHWTFTYCQGIYIGANHELYNITGDNKYKDQAIESINATLKLKCDSTSKALPDEGDGDGGLFKGILIRYIGDFISEYPIDSINELYMKYGEKLYANGTNQKGLYSKTWFVQPGEREDLSVQLSGVILLEQLYRISLNK